MSNRNRRPPKNTPASKFFIYIFFWGGAGRGGTVVCNYGEGVKNQRYSLEPPARSLFAFSASAAAEKDVSYSARLNGRPAVCKAASWTGFQTFWHLKTLSRSSSRELRIRVPDFFLQSIVVGEPSPKKGYNVALLGDSVLTWPKDSVPRYT